MIVSIRKLISNSIDNSIILTRIINKMKNHHINNWLFSMYLDVHLEHSISIQILFDNNLRHRNWGCSQQLIEIIWQFLIGLPFRRDLNLEVAMKNDSNFRLSGIESRSYV